MKNAYIYARVSTDEQAKHGYSIGAQLDSLREYAAKHDYFVVNEYLDEGVSGQKGYKKRPALTAMLQRLDGIDVILFIKLDRWFRSVKLYYEVQDILDEHGVSWIATQEDYETVTSAGKFKVNIMLSIAQAESERTSERIKFVFDAKRAKGEKCSGKVPIGFKVENKFLAIDENGAEIVREVFSTYVDTHSIVAVQTMLREKHGLSYSYEGIKTILERRDYLGTDDLPAIVDRETFRRAQELRASRSQRHSRTNANRIYLFAGMIYCRECGGRMRGSYDAKNDHKYYGCAIRYTYGSARCKHSKYIREDAVEAYLLSNILSSIDEYNLRQQAEYEERSKTIQKKDPDKIKRKMQKLKDLYLDDLISKDVYEADYRRLQHELDSMTVYAPKLIEKADIEQALSLYSTFTDESKKAFWNRIIRRIETENDGSIFFTPNAI